LYIIGSYGLSWWYKYHSDFFFISIKRCLHYSFCNRFCCLYYWKRVMSGMMLAFSGGSYGAAPVNTVAPVVSGTATVGQTLSTTNGTWTGAPAPTFTYQWQRTGVDIGGATSSTYVLVAADYANTIRCVVRATNIIAPAGVTANSNSTASVAGNAPVNTVAPAVTGTATVGQTLSTTNGTWTGVPTPTFTYQWQRVTTNISGATSSTYVLVAADAGNTIRCVVTGTNAVSAVSANSNSTASVAAIAPGAPTIGTATATGVTTATVVYTAPASNGGATITSYTATSSPSGITGTLSQAGSGTITVSGLSGGTSYTFTVTATNSAGTSAASAASNSITTNVAPSQQAFITAGTYSWVAPAGVTKVSVVAVGAGSSSPGSGYGGGGAGLGYKNNYTVAPGCSYTVVVGTPNQSTVNMTSYFINTCTVAGRGPSITAGVRYLTGGTYVGDGGGNGGNGKSAAGGAGGYSGAGGNANCNGATGCSGAGGGGGASGTFRSSYTGGGGGGGVGILGQGSNGAGGIPVVGGAGATSTSSGGKGGSGGTNGGSSSVYINCCGSPCSYSGLSGVGGDYGGGGGRQDCFYRTTTGGGKGAVRIIWPGSSRSFPSTCTGNL
jgi:hypothetical protein